MEKLHDVKISNVLYYYLFLVISRTMVHCGNFTELKGPCRKHCNCQKSIFFQGKEKSSLLNMLKYTITQIHHRIFYFLH